MKLGLYWGCVIPTSQYAYELSIRETFPKLGIELIDYKDTTCCGSPIASINDIAAIFMALRNIALAEKAGIEDLLVPCNGCHLRMTESIHEWKSKPEIKKRIEVQLAEEGISFSNSVNLWHVVDYLHDVVGLERLQESRVKSLEGYRIATHPGCHLFRPSSLPRSDDAEKPVKLDNLVAALGCEIVDYQEKLDCCGAGLLLSHPEAGLSLTGEKLKALSAKQIDALVTSCPSCQMMYDAKQQAANATIGFKGEVPVLYYTQLLGISLGISENLGLELNQSNIDQLLERLQV